MIHYIGCGWPVTHNTEGIAVNVLTSSSLPSDAITSTVCAVPSCVLLNLWSGVHNWGIRHYFLNTLGVLSTFTVLVCVGTNTLTAGVAVIPGGSG